MEERREWTEKAVAAVSAFIVVAAYVAALIYLVLTTR